MYYNVLLTKYPPQINKVYIQILCYVVHLCIKLLSKTSVHILAFLYPLH